MHMPQWNLARSLVRLALLVVALAGVAPLSSASAEDASGPLVDAIWYKWERIPEGVFNDYYLWSETWEAQWTPNGGAFLFSNGNVGRGAIYARNVASFGGSRIETSLVYGDFLRVWSNNGYETGRYGWPRGDEGPAKAGGCKDYHPAAVRQQMFGSQFLFCWWPEGGTKIVRLPYPLLD